MFIFGFHLLEAILSIANELSSAKKFDAGDPKSSGRSLM